MKGSLCNAAFICLVLSLLSSSALASEVGDPTPRAFEPVPTPTLPVLNLSRFLEAGAQLDVTYQPNPIMKQVYERRGPFALDLFVRVLFDERVGLGVRAGVQRRPGTGVAPEGEPPEVVLWQAPVFLEGVLRMALVRNQPIVPYVRGGLGVVLAWERIFLATSDEEGAEGEAETEESDTSRVPDSVWFGRKLAVEGGGGVQIRMPFPELQWEGSMAGPGFSDLYLHIEGWARAANDFGRPGVDLSTVGASAGITFLF